MNSNVNIGSWIFGSGSVKLKTLNKLIYAMRVDEIITMEEYWNDSRFSYKKPIIPNGSLPQVYGDNFYHKDINGNWIQENSAHSNNEGLLNESHLARDVSGNNVLISLNFFYFGRNAITIPAEFIEVIFTKGRNWAYAKPEESIISFIEWLSKTHEKNIIHGDPINWPV
jgi:hypothetical protein